MVDFKYLKGVEQFDIPEGTILKGLNDHRNVRFLTLPNNLRAVLVNDPTCQSAAASMNVRVGSIMNPPELLGLAHFLEHMLFLGSKKYPDEAEYKRFLAQHAGTSNASTSPLRTKFYFTVGHANLEGALDRFAQFFISPCFDASATERELNAVHSEHIRNLSRNERREYMLYIHTSNSRHPNNRFHTGDLTTLRDRPCAEGIDVREALLSFYEKYYSANIMTLAVVGRESLEELEAMVTSKFSEVVDKGVDIPFFDKICTQETAFETNNACGKFLIWEPMTEFHKMTIELPLGRVFDAESKKWVQEFPSSADDWSGVAHLIGMVLGDESDGSACANLTSRGIIVSLSAGMSSIPSFSPSVHTSITFSSAEAATDPLVIRDVVSTLLAEMRLIVLEFRHSEEGRQKLIDMARDAIITGRMNVHTVTAPTAAETANSLAEQASLVPPNLLLVNPKLAGLAPKGCEGPYNNTFTETQDIFRVSHDHAVYVAERAVSILEGLMTPINVNGNPRIPLEIQIQSKAYSSYFDQVEPIFSTPYVSIGADEDSHANSELLALKNMIYSAATSICTCSSKNDLLNVILPTLSPSLEHGPNLKLAGQNPFIPHALNLNHPKEMLPTFREVPVPSRLLPCEPDRTSSSPPRAVAFYTPDKYFSVPTSSVSSRIHLRGWCCSRDAESDLSLRWIEDEEELLARSVCLEVYLQAQATAMKRMLTYKAEQGGLSFFVEGRAGAITSVLRVQLGGYDENMLAFVKRVIPLLLLPKHLGGCVPTKLDIETALAVLGQIWETNQNSLSPSNQMLLAHALLNNSDCPAMATPNPHEMVHLVKNINPLAVLALFEDHGLMTVLLKDSLDVSVKEVCVAPSRQEAISRLPNAWRERRILDVFMDFIGFGNFTKDQYMSICECISDFGGNSQLSSAKYVNPEVPSLTASAHLIPSYGQTCGDFPSITERVVFKNQNVNDKNRSVFYSLNLGSRVKDPLIELPSKDDPATFVTRAHPQDVGMTMLLTHLSRQPFFFQMRTQQRLGYVVKAFENGSRAARVLPPPPLPTVASNVCSIKHAGRLGVLVPVLTFAVETSRVGSGRARLRIEEFLEQSFGLNFSASSSGNDENKLIDGLLLTDAHLMKAKSSVLTDLERVPATRSGLWGKLINSLMTTPTILLDGRDSTMHNHFKNGVDVHETLERMSTEELRNWIKERVGSGRGSIIEMKLEGDSKDGMEGQEGETHERIAEDARRHDRGIGRLETVFDAFSNDGSLTASCNTDSLTKLKEGFWSKMKKSVRMRRS